MPSPFRHFALIALAALALLAPATAVAAEQTVSVTAEATLKVPNDTASVGLSVSRERRSRGAALRAVSNGLHRVIGAAQGIAGVEAGDIVTGRISVRKAFRGNTHGTHTLYRASEGIAVTIHQPDNAGDLVSAAIGAGATGVSGPNFFVGDSEQAFGKALAAAFDKAKAKAAILATQAGASLGPAITIDEGSGPELVPEPEAKGVSGPTSSCGSAGIAKRSSQACAAPPPTKPGTSTVTATVHVVFALQ
jgi:uncharacterized protein YggE